jgi:chaperonin GroES
VGEEGDKIPMEVKKGDKVLYGKYSGTEVTIADVEYLIMRESDIFAIIG